MGIKDREENYEVYWKISKMPGCDISELSEELGWNVRKTHESVTRLLRDNWIRLEKDDEVEGERRIKIVPIKWYEYLTPAEIEEFKSMKF